MLSRPPPSSRDLCRAALRETLERKGTLDRVKAQIRAEVFHSMDAEARRVARRVRVTRVRLIPFHHTRAQGDAHPLLTHEHLLLNEAIREYLQFAGYEHTLSVFMAGAPSALLPYASTSPTFCAASQRRRSPLNRCLAISSLASWSYRSCAPLPATTRGPTCARAANARAGRDAPG